MTVSEAIDAIATYYPCRTYSDAVLVLQAVVVLRLLRPKSGGISGASYVYDDTFLDRVQSEAQALVDAEAGGGVFVRGETIL